MATLDQIGAALKAADAAGNTADATRLAAAYRAAQGQQAPAQPAQPPQPVAAPQSLGDQLSAGFTAGVNALPLVGPQVLGGLERLKSAVQGRPFEDVQATDQAQKDANPVASTVGVVAGNALPFMAVGPETLLGKGLGMSGPLLQRVAAGAVSGATLNAADTAIRGGSLQDVGTSAIEGGAIAGGLPLVGSLVKGIGGALKAPLSAAPVASELKADAGAAYDAARAGSNGAKFQPTAFAPLHQDMTAIASDAGVVLPDGKVAAGYSKVKGALQATKQFAASSGPVTIQQQATLRKIIGNVAASSDRTEAMVGSKMLDGFDSYFDNLPDAAFVGSNSAGPQAMANLAAARKAYATAMRTQTFEGVVQQAKRAGGSDAAYRQAFGTFLNSARKTRGFPPDQIAAIEQFVQGGPIQKLVRVLSGRGPVTDAVVGGMTAGPIGAGIGAVASPVLKAAAGRAAAGRAEALRGIVAGAPRGSAMDQWLQRLTNLNDNPVNLGALPQTLAGLTTGL